MQTYVRYLLYPLSFLLPFSVITVATWNEPTAISAAWREPAPEVDAALEAARTEQWIKADEAEQSRTLEIQLAETVRVAAEEQIAAETAAAAAVAEAAEAAAKVARQITAVPRTTATTARYVAPQPAQSTSAIGERIAQCESGGSYTAQNPRSSASGKYQFLDSTWNGYGGYASAKDAPPAVQEAKFAETYAVSGTTPWNASRSCWA